jgi:hypothetical protein
MVVETTVAVTIYETAGFTVGVYTWKDIVSHYHGPTIGFGYKDKAVHVSRTMLNTFKRGRG